MLEANSALVTLDLSNNLIGSLIEVRRLSALPLLELAAPGAVTRGYPRASRTRLRAPRPLNKRQQLLRLRVAPEVAARAGRALERPRRDLHLEDPRVEPVAFMERGLRPARLHQGVLQVLLAGLVALEPRIALADEGVALRQNGAGEVLAANRPRDGLRGTEP